MIIYSITLVSKVMYYIQVTITHEDNGYKYDYRTQKNNQDIQSIQEPRSWASPSPVNCSELVWPYMTVPIVGMVPPAHDMSGAHNTTQNSQNK